jgi:predicted outer membrane repeat protein
MKTRLLILALAALAAQAAVRAAVLEVPLTPQEQNNWCWAACTKAVLSYYQKPVEERQLAHFACLRNGWSTSCDCWNDPGGSACNQANGICTADYAGAIQNLLANWGLSSTCGQGTCSFDSLEARIDTQHRPLIARLQKGQTIGHFVVIRGASESGGTQWVHCMNPWPPNVGEYTMTPYNSFVNDGTWSWTHTLKVSRRYPPVIYDVSTVSLYSTIQSAIDAASEMDQVWIANGTYTGPGNQDISFGGKSITVRSYSGNPDDVVIDPQDNHRAFNLVSLYPGAVLEGVTLRDGQAAHHGGAIYDSAASPTILNCHFADNVAVGGRGGAIYAVYSTLSLIGCRMTGNVARTYGGAVAIGRHSSPALVGCSLGGNRADMYGGGAWFDDSAMESARTPVIKDCTFTSNTATLGGGGLCCRRNLTPHVSGCTFTGNQGAYGGGIAFYGHVDGRIQKCTLSYNSVTGVGGGISVADTSHPAIDHTIVSFSGDGCGVHCQTSGTVALSCVDIYGNADGDWQGESFQGQLGQNGNVSVDPAFCGIQNPGDPYTLTSASPCAARNNSECGQIGAKGIGCGLSPVPGMGYGVFIAHHAPGAIYTDGEDACARYQTDFAIHDCAEQNNRIDGTSPTVWYVLSAWETEKQWCGTQFGLGPFDPESFVFQEWGKCGPPGTLEVATPGWPGPNRGVVLSAPTGGSWAGNFVPVYWFAGYAYHPGVVPLTPHPQLGSGGWTDCATPPETWQASCFGSMGMMAEGSYCCPGGVPASIRACCAADGTCALVSEPACADLGGAWHEDWPACSPNPCPPPVAVCCVQQSCALVSQAECEGFGGVWHAGWASCRPDPCVPPIDWADHGIGDCVLSVTDRGILGFMDGTQQQGSGFVYPKDGENQVFIGSLWVGLSPTYIANRDYDVDPAKEWRVSAEPNGHVWLDEEGHSQLDIHAAYTDSAAAQPRRLFVDQESWSYSADAVDDFVILRYRVSNHGGTTLANAYVGLFLDADLDSMIYNEGRVDAGRRLVYLTDRDTSDLHVGVRLLGDAPLGNLTLIRNSTYVWPTGYLPDAHKFGFLSASAPEYVVTQTPAPDDYSLLAAAGPFSIAPQDDVLCAFAVVGGTSYTRLLEHADAAAAIYSGTAQGAPWDPALAPGATRLLPSAPNPFGDRLWIGFDLARPGRARLTLYDAAGRRLRTILEGRLPAMRHVLAWDGRDDAGRAVPSGVYFLRLSAAGAEETQRLIRIR